LANNAFYDFSEWHSGAGCRLHAVPSHGGVGVMLLCLACGKAADLEALNGRCGLLESAERRRSPAETVAAAGLS
jgi:hypothetical protein